MLAASPSSPLYEACRASCPLADRPFQMGSLLFFLSYKYNDELDWASPAVLVTLCLAVALFVVFVLVELLVAPEPVLAPFLVRQKVPVIIGISSFLV